MEIKEIYLTKGTMNSFVRDFKYDEEKIDEILNSIINSDKLLLCLNSKEKKDLFYHYLVCSIDDDSIKEMQYVGKTSDSDYINISESSKKYHLYSDCEFLRSDFEGFLIPFDFKKYAKENDKNLIKELRDWWKEEKCQEKIDLGKQDVVVMRYNLLFANKYGLQPLTSLDELYINLPNSGETGIDISFSKDELINLIQERLDKYFSMTEASVLYKNLYLINTETREVRQEFWDFLFRKYSWFRDEYSDEERINFVAGCIKGARFKNEMIDYLKKLIFLEFNNISGLNEDTLQGYGLELCRNCYGRTNNIEFDFDFPDLPF